MSDNRYESGYGLYVTNTVLSDVATYGGIGAAAGTAGGGAWGAWGALIGAGVGLISGGIRGHYEYLDNVKTDRELNVNKRFKFAKERNRSILSGKDEVATTRASFDTKYGSGMFDKFDEIFTGIFNAADTKNLSLADIYEGMSYDKFAGQITSSLTGENAPSKGALETVLSMDKISGMYYNFLADKMKSSDTAFSLALSQNSKEEKRAIEDYNSDMSMLNYSIQNEINQLNSNRILERGGELAELGAANARQGASGLKQNGNLVSLQQFQMDIAEVAYISNLNYYTKTYQQQGVKLGQEMAFNVESLRQQTSLTIKEHLENLIAAYNKMNTELKKEYGNTSSLEGAIYETNDAISDADDFVNRHNAAWDTDTTTGNIEMEDLF